MKKEVEKLLQYVQKPARYIGGELNAVVKDKEKVDIRYAFCFPDTYEIGMSHLGMKILYGLVNDRDDSWCERVFAPDNDMEEQLRKNNVPLFALESGDYIKDFDMIGFTLQYELSYTNILNMLNLAQIPLKSSDRESLTDLELTHINLLDDTAEGVKCEKDKLFSVQYHPESAPGPQDSAYLFDKFIALMQKEED